MVQDTRPTAWQWLLNKADEANRAITPYTQAFGSPLQFPVHLGVRALNTPVGTAPPPPPPVAGDPITGAVRAAAGAAPTPAAASTGGSRGDRNRNPGNLRASSWTRGQPGFQGQDKDGFAIFDSAANGIAAQERLLTNNYINNGFTTPWAIVNRYAPGNENSLASRQNYAKYIADQLGININDPVAPAQAPALARAMREFETGNTRGSATRRNLQQAATDGSGVFASIDPAQAMAMLGDPMMLRRQMLPAAPQAAMPEARPQYEAASRDMQGFQDLVAAMQMPERDRSGENWDRATALLQGLAGGFAQAQPGQDFGSVLAMAGAAGLGEFRGEQQAQRDQLREEQLMQQQLNIALARAGFDIDLSALDTRNTNKDQGWLSGEDRRSTTFSNDTARFNRDLNQFEHDTGIDQFNAGVTNQFKLQRAQAGLGALETQVEAANQGTIAAANAAQAAPQQVEQTLDARIRGFGIEPTPESRAVALALQSNQPTAALPYLASSIVMQGKLDFLDEADAQKVEQYLRNEDTAPMAVAVVQRALAASYQRAKEDPAMAAGLQGLIDDLALSGDPVGIVMRGYRGGQ